MSSILTDPNAPHRPADPTDFEQALMQAAVDDLAQFQDTGVHGTRLLALIPDAHPEMPHRMGGLRPEHKAAVERVTGRAVEGPPLQTRPGLCAPNPARARSEMKRWAVRWHAYLTS